MDGDQPVTLRDVEFAAASSAELAVMGCGWVLFVLTIVGCDSPGDDEGADTDRAEQTSDRDAGSGGDAGRAKTAYGLPLPPSTEHVRRYDGSVEVETRMSIDELVAFYRRRLVDYEILRPTKWKLRIVGLRDFMPSIRGHEYGPLVYLTYLPRRRRPRPAPPRGSAEEESAGEKGGRAEEADAPAESAPSTGGGSVESTLIGPAGQPHEKGEPVRLKTPDGELLAPGAKWGEPYTPPEGSPLHKPMYRSNFGEPFGEWKLP
ncbi:MAG: hypothetical protein ABEL76_11855 [Bradymonadaceae bacterium]